MVDFFFSLVPLEPSNPILHSVFPRADQHFADLFPAPQSTPEHPASITAEFESVSAIPLAVGGALAYRDLGVVFWRCCLYSHVVEEAASLPGKQIY